MGMLIDKESPRYLQDQGFAAGPVLVSYLGVVYQRGFFDDSIFDYTDTSQQCKYQDDMWFSAHLARNGIKRYVLGSALGVSELTEFHLGPSSLTFWKENKPRRVSHECNDGLVRRDPDIWRLRRRLVLVVAGLPPVPAMHIRAGLDEPWHTHLAAARGWDKASSLMRQLPLRADLIYLCTDISSASDHGKPIGSFPFGGLLATISGNCPAHVAELPVSKAMRDPLQWEGDADTVLVLGTLQ